MSNELDKVRKAKERSEEAKLALHSAIREASASGARAVEIAEASGLSRQRVYQILGPKRIEPSREAMESRLAALDARWEALVDEVAAMERPPDAHIQRENAKRNARRGKDARKGLPRRPSVLEESRSLAESKLLRTLHDHADDPGIVSVLAEIMEANALRETLEASYDRSLGIA